MKKRTGMAIVGVLLALGPIGAGQGAGDDHDRPPEVDPEEVDSIWEYLTGRYDRDEDQKISREEYTRSDDHFARLDRDGDGTIEKTDVERKRGRGDRDKARGRRGERQRAVAPSEGDLAPDFALELLIPKKKGKTRESDETEKIRLSSFKGKKPVALVFGSYT